VKSAGKDSAINQYIELDQTKCALNWMVGAVALDAQEAAVHA